MRKQDETMKVIYYSWESRSRIFMVVDNVGGRFTQVIVGIAGDFPVIMLSACWHPNAASLRHFPQWGNTCLIPRIGHSNHWWYLWQRCHHQDRDDILCTKVDDSYCRFTSLYSNADQNLHRITMFVSWIKMLWVGSISWRVWWKTGIRLPEKQSPEPRFIYQSKPWEVLVLSFSFYMNDIPWLLLDGLTLPY